MPIPTEETPVVLWQVWLVGLGAIMALMVGTWVASLVRRDASLVDRVWGFVFVVAVWAYAVAANAWTPRTWLVLVLVTVWGLRLSIYLTWRNWGHGEDPRYVKMRERNPDTFAARSLVTIFVLQGVIGWVVSLPLLIAAGGEGALGWIDALGVAAWLVGFAFEAGGDAQLSRFLADPGNRGKVLDRGFWRYTRHPNYFGDTVVWWSFFILALPAGGWWTAVGPLLMTVVIVKVSGVALTERNMESSSREGRDEYVRRTNAFIPGPRKPA
jgi:steroid 5-alpha reductase family enzyme